ncbi:MAG: lytic transglycosylase domain-containing protein [Pikeienuella sp.]
MGKLRRECGTPVSVVAGTLVLTLLIGGLSAESLANSTYLENGVRAGDRSGLTIKRPPRPGAKRFAPATRVAPKPSRRQRHAWFWETTSPEAAAATPTRWAQLVARMQTRRATGQSLVSGTRVSKVAERWGAEVKAAARRHRISEALILAVIAVESSGNPRAVSPKGATGLMQLMPGTGKRFGVTDRTDPKQNLAGGTAYLDFLLDKFGGDVVLALAGYNAGENAVDRHGGVPPYAETRDYVVLVLDAVAGIAPLCAEPPESPRRACLLRNIRAPRA